MPTWATPLTARRSRSSSRRPTTATSRRRRASTSRRPALQENFGFSPATAQWEAFAQGRQGATMVLKVASGADFDVLADNLRSAGYDEAEGGRRCLGGRRRPGGRDRPDDHPGAAVRRAARGPGPRGHQRQRRLRRRRRREVASGDANSFASVDGVAEMADRLGDPANAMVWGKDFACDDLAMSRADEDDQAAGRDELVQEAGGVTPLAGLAMAMEPNRTLRVVAHFEDAERAEKNLRPRAQLAVGEAVGRGGSFADDFELTVVEGRRQRRRARPAARGRRPASSSPRCTTGRCCSRPAERPPAATSPAQQRGVRRAGEVAGRQLRVADLLGHRAQVGPRLLEDGAGAGVAGLDEDPVAAAAASRRARQVPESPVGSRCSSTGPTSATAASSCLARPRHLREPDGRLADQRLELEDLEQAVCLVEGRLGLVPQARRGGGVARAPAGCSRGRGRRRRPAAAATARRPGRGPPRGRRSASAIVRHAGPAGRPRASRRRHLVRDRRAPPRGASGRPRSARSAWPRLRARARRSRWPRAPRAPRRSATRLARPLLGGRRAGRASARSRRGCPG